MSFFSYQQLLSRFGDDPHPRARIEQEVREDRLWRLCPGWYTDEEAPSETSFANLLVEPSYISLPYALCLYDLIPESVFHVSSAFPCNRDVFKGIETEIGIFYYQSIPPRAFSSGLYIATDLDGSRSLMATREKALCDYFFTQDPPRSVKEVEVLLFNDLRVDDFDFFNLDLRYIAHLAPLYGTLHGYYMRKFVARYIVDTYSFPASNIALYESMLVEKEVDQEDLDAENEVRERIQKLVLAALSKTGFFDRACFCGAAALRFFHGLPRYTRDIDFELLEADESFSFSSCLSAITDELSNLGLRVASVVETREGDHLRVVIKLKKRALYKWAGKSYALLARIHWNTILPIQIDIQTIPVKNTVIDCRPLEADTNLQIRVFDLSTLFAYKLAAFLFNYSTSNGIGNGSGRDMYDLVYLIEKSTSFNVSVIHFFNYNNYSSYKEEYLKTTLFLSLWFKIKKIDYEIYANEVKPLVVDRKFLDGWNNDFFKDLLTKMKKNYAAYSGIKTEGVLLDANRHGSVFWENDRKAAISVRA